MWKFQSSLPRRRCAGSAQDTPYSHTDAMTEYKAMMADYEAKRVARQSLRPTYRSRHCSLLLPAEAYGVNQHGVADV